MGVFKLNKQGVHVIAIVGAGFCGAITAINLVRLAREHDHAVQIVLIDAHASHGKGLAYSTEDDNFVLNVPIGNMSAFPDKPDDFLQYCVNVDASLLPGSFIFRRLYGEYIEERLNQARSEHSGQLVEVQNIVTGIHRKNGLFELSMGSGPALVAETVILAFGHFPPRSMAEIFGNGAKIVGATQDNFSDNPWDTGALNRLPVDQDVMIVGTGHTAIDTLFRLVSCPSARKVYLLSRHGLLPNGHRKADEFRKMPALAKVVETAVRRVLADGPKVRTLFSTIRRLAQQHIAQGGDWREVINNMRPMTPEIWQRLPDIERARFLRHIVCVWDVLRHRLSPMAMRRLDGLLASNRVEVIAGRVMRLDPDPIGVGLCATLKLRGKSQICNLKLGSLVNCSGPTYDIDRVDNPLVQQLRSAGVLRRDAMKIGFDVDDDYRCCTLPNLHYIGPMLKAKYWEAIAVPELRVHAFNLAKIVLLQRQAGFCHLK
jgi:uncharacterized NAD(P)/FAD-binding protein YdhS